MHYFFIAKLKYIIFFTLTLQVFTLPAQEKKPLTHGALYTHMPLLSICYGEFTCTEPDGRKYNIKNVIYAISPDPFHLEDGPAFQYGSLKKELLFFPERDLSQVDDAHSLSPDEYKWLNITICKNYERYGYEMGFQFNSGILSGIPLPYLNLKRGNLKQYYVSASLFDFTDLMLYSLGFHYKTGSLETHIKGGLLKKNLMGSIRIVYNIHHHFRLQLQAFVRADDNPPAFRFGVALR